MVTINNLSKTAPRRTKRKILVTILVGLKCADAIVLASESRTSDPNGRIVDDTKKLAVIDFINGSAMVASSGLSSLSIQMEERFKQKARAVEIVNSETIIRTAEETIREIRQSQFALFPGHYSLEEWQKHFYEQEPLELLIAYYFESKPYLYRLHIARCVGESVTTYFASAGCGSDLGEFLLLEIAQPNTGSLVGTVMAIHVVETVKKHNAYCGGPVQVGWIRPSFGTFSMSEPVVLLPANRIEELSILIAQAEQNTKSTRNIEFVEALQEITSRRMNDFMADFINPGSAKVPG